LEACAGLAAIIKTVYILESGLIPPTIHFKKGNPEIKFDEWNLEVPTKLTPWPTEGLRRISTNSFGYGGTNCHAILDDTSHYLQDRGIYGRSDKVHVNRAHNKGTYNNFTNASEVHANEDSKLNGPVKQHGPRVFLLSAQDKDGLKRIKKSIADFLDEMSERIKHNSIEEENFLTDLAHTLNARRSLLCWKTYGIATSLKGLCQTWRDDQSTALVSRSSRSVRIGFIFTGQGAQWARMGAELIRYTVFRESVEAADSYIRTHLKCTWSIVEELQKTKTTSRLHLAVCSQTLCTVLQVALVELLRTWNISPVAVAGHSAGEMAAAYCIGAIRREDAWKVAYWRGVLSSGLKTIAPDISGAMMAVGLTPDAAKLLISKTTKGRVIVACVNAPTSVTLSGDAAAIDELAELLKDSGVFARKLQVDTAYHSHHMQILASDCLDAIADIKTLKPSTTRNMHSCVTGFGVEPSELGPSYWVKNMTSPVYFAPAVHDLLRPMDRKGVRATQNAVDVLVEIGPHCALQGPTTQTLKANGITNIPYMSALVRNQDAITSMLNLVGSLVAQGFPIELSRANNDDRNSSYTPKPLTNLPKYNWNHTQKYWTESRIGKEYRLRKKPHLSLLGAPAPSIVAGESIWRGFVRLSEEPWVADHKIHGAILYPAAGFLAMAIEAAVQNAKNSRDVAAFRLRDVQFIAAAVATEESDLEFTLQLRPHITGTRTANSIWLEFVISSSGDGTNLQKNCSGLMILEYESENSQSKSEQAAEAAKAHRQYQQAESHCGIVVNTAKFYADMSTIGLIYGPSFANLTQIRGQKGQACGMVEVPNVSALAPKEFRSTPHVIHPGTLDAIFHLAFAALGERQLRSAMVPKSIDEVIISANISSQAGTQLAGFANAEKHGFKDMQADITIFENHRTEPVVQISGLCCSEVGGGNSGQSEAKKICSRLTWQPAIEFLSLEQQETVIETHKVTDLAPRRHFNSLAEEIPIPDHTVFIKTQSLVAIRIKLIKVALHKLLYPMPRW
jgi:acyl transferase domain-containing protein